MSPSDVPHDLSGPGVSLLADDALCVDRADRVPARQPAEIVEGGEALRLAPFWIDCSEVRKRHDRGDGLAGAFDDDPLAAGGGVDDLTEAPTNVESRHRSHGGIIALT
jgi:hypothetical protein